MTKKIVSLLLEEKIVLKKYWKNGEGKNGTAGKIYDGNWKLEEKSKKGKKK